MSKIFFYSWRKDCLPDTLLSILVPNIIVVHLHHKLDTRSILSAITSQGSRQGSDPPRISRIRVSLCDWMGLPQWHWALLGVAA
eukprot:scaffold1991_cov73-Skeletonema_marinoi.AAC.2